MAWDQSVTCELATGECVNLNRQGTLHPGNFAPQRVEGRHAEVPSAKDVQKLS
jgi:hypothetical protein